MLSKITLSNTSLSVSQLCYGSNIFGTAIDQGRVNAILDRFIELGGNFIDTARSYGDWAPAAPAGASERAIGAWLKGRRSEGIVVGTKGGQFDMRAGDWRNRCTPEDLRQDLFQSLDHLGLDRIPLYWLHADNLDASVEPIIDALLDHQAAGRIQYFGASNWEPQRIREANAYAETQGRQGFVASQTFWGLAVPARKAAAAQGYQLYYEGGYETLHAEGLPIVAYAGQSGGYFSKLSQGDRFVPIYLHARYDNPANQTRFEAVKALAIKHSVSPNEIALAYLTSQPYQTIPIIGGSNPDRIEESVRAASLKLSAEELARLRGV